MKLLIFRHGIAADAGTTSRDEERALTPEGVKKTRLAARGLSRLIDRPDVILTSPKVRAAQTALILGQVFDRKPRIMKELGEESAAKIIQALRKVAEEIVMVVGHEPTLSQVIERLCVAEGVRHFVDLKKAGCACVDVPRKGDVNLLGVLRWLVTPKMLARMGKG